jgi:hypothetical protein
VFPYFLFAGRTLYLAQVSLIPRRYAHFSRCRPWDFRDDISEIPEVAYVETAFSSARAWSIWS